MLDKNYLANLTQEERDEIRQRAQETRLAKKENSANIRASADTDHWKELASKYGVRLPQSVCQANEHKYIRKISRLVGLDLNVWVKEVVCAANISEVADLNPNIGAIGMCGLFLEWVDEVKSASI